MLQPRIDLPGNRGGIYVDPPTNFSPFKKKDPIRGYGAGIERPQIDTEMIINHAVQNSNMIEETFNPTPWFSDNPYGGKQAPNIEKIEGFRPSNEHFAYGVKEEQPVTPIPAFFDEGDTGDIVNPGYIQRETPASLRIGVEYSAHKNYEVPILNEIPTINKTRIMTSAQVYNPAIKNVPISYPNVRKLKRKQVVGRPRVVSSVDISAPIAPRNVVSSIKKPKKMRRRAVRQYKQRIQKDYDFDIPIREPVMEVQEKKQVVVERSIDPDLDADIEALLNEPRPSFVERKKVQLEVKPTITKSYDTSVLPEVKKDILRINKEREQPHVNPRIEKRYEDNILPEIKKDILSINKQHKQPEVRPRVDKGTEEVKIIDNILNSFIPDVQNILREPMFVQAVPIYAETQFYKEPSVRIEELPDDYIDEPKLHAGYDVVELIEGPKQEIRKDKITKPDQNINSVGDREDPISPEDTLSSLHINLKR